MIRFLIIGLFLCSSTSFFSAANFSDPNTTVRITSVDPYSGHITMTNLGFVQYNITDFWLCYQPSYTKLNNITPIHGDYILDPGESVTVQWATIICSQDDGELALYNTNSFNSFLAVEDYFQWGSINHGREDEATNAGVWFDDEFKTGNGPYFFNGGPGSYGVSFWNTLLMGCTYPDAENFDSNANKDDGTCTFSLGSSCPGDADGNGEVSILDLVSVSSNFGNSCL